jgi:hypothetical protein
VPEAEAARRRFELRRRNTEIEKNAVHARDTQPRQELRDAAERAVDDGESLVVDQRCGTHRVGVAIERDETSPRT